jgi:hypothetical protein
VEDWPQNLRSTVAAHLSPGKGRVTSALAKLGRSPTSNLQKKWDTATDIQYIYICNNL